MTRPNVPPSGKPVPPRPVSKTAPRVAAVANARPVNYSGMPFWIGLALSILWVGVVGLALSQAGASHTFGGLPLVSWAIGISAIASPVGLIWMVTAYLQRASDVQSVAEPLRRQLMMITGESSAAEVRIRRFNQAIREQLELLKNTQNVNHGDLMAIMDRVRQHKNELEQFEQHSIYQVKEIQEVIRRSMQHIEQLMEDKFTMLRILDNKLVQSGDDVSRQTEAVRDQIASLLQEIEANTHLVGASLEKAMLDTRKIADTARAQEASLINAAENASGTLQDLSGKIDMTIVHFLERVGAAREEAERLAKSLDTQTRSLDEFSNTLPSRVSETESVLRGVTDRLYASEQKAREQASQLGERLAEQAGGLEKLLDRFSSRLNDIDGSLQQRRSDLDGLVVRISGATDDLAQQLEGAISNLGDRAHTTLQQFITVNDEARRGADEIAANLAATTARYEAAARQLHGLAEANSEQLRTITSDIDAQLRQFETLQNASNEAGAEVQTRASAALQNLQQVLERLLATRDATHSVSDTLTDKLRAAVEQNEHIIVRINEAAQMTVHALGIATESLGRQEGEMGTRAQAVEETIRSTIRAMQEQARTAEQEMRDHNERLRVILKETQDRLDGTDQRLQDFAARAAAPVQQAMQQIETSTAQGSEAVGRYSGDMQEQLNRLQQFNARVGNMGEEVSRMTADTLSSIEQMNSRFLAARAAQEETARATLDQFTSLADRLQREVGSLGDQTTQAVVNLQQAVTQVGQQSQQLQREAQDSGSQIQVVTTALLNEAAQIRSVLQKQADDLNADLLRAERQFMGLGESLKQRTDVAYALLDRMATHYNEMTRSVTDEFDLRATRLEQTAAATHGKVEDLNTSLAQQLNLIGSGASQLEGHAAQLSATNGKTLQQLSALNEKMALTQESTIHGAQQVMARLEETSNALIRQQGGVSDAAQNAVLMVQKAGTAFGEQASKLLDNTHQVEQIIRSLNAATTAFADQSTQIRSTMEQHNQRLLNSLTESVGQIDSVSAKLQQAAATATLGADQASSRFDAMTQAASERLGGSSQELVEIANKTETTLGALSASITQQVASLNIVGDQIGEQYRALTAANENQRQQLVDLFEKLGAAHGQASEVAERTIARLSDDIQQIQRQLGALGDQSQAAIANVRTAGAGFADQAGLMLQHAQQAEQQARTVLSVTSALQEQARQLREALHSEGDRTGELLGALLGKLGSGNTELRDLSATAEATLTTLQHNVGNQVASLNGAMQQIADRQRSLTTALDAQRDVLNGLISRLTLAQDETATSAERGAARLAESTQQITRQMETIDAQAQNTLASVHNATAGFMDEAASLGRHAEQSEQLTRILFATATTIQDQARQTRESMQGESERMGEVLNAMLGKLSAGNNELRDLSSTAETRLSGLQTIINEQTATLNNLIQQIGERQRSLAASLDTQSDTLSGLLDRFSLAQDETAAVTERNVARLTDSTQQIARQLEAIDAQAQSALVNVRAASAGFVDESGSINLHAQQAEQQVRGLLSVTAGMQEQTRQLRESLQSDSSRVIENLNEVIGKLDNTGERLRQQSGNIVHSMDQSVLEFTKLAQTTDETLQRQADTLKAVAEKAEERVLSAGEKVRSHFGAVTEATELVEGQARQLADTAEHATARLATLRATMADSDKEGRDILAQATARINEVKATLQRELDNVAEISQLAVQQVAAAGELLAQQSDTLRTNLASSESALTQAASIVREEAAQIPAIVSRSASQIEASGKALKDQNAEVADAMVRTADRFINVTGSVRDSMMDELRNLGTVADAADQTLRQFNQALSQQIEAIKAGAGALSNEQKEMVEKSAQTLAQLNAASDRLANVRNDALKTTEKLAREFETIETAATSTTQRLAHAEENLGKQVLLLTQMTERAEGQMTTATQGFREQFERVRTGLKMQIDDINRGLMQITAQLERTGTTLRSATSGAVTDIEKIAGRLDQSSKDTSHQLTDRTARMRVATEEVARLLNGFGDHIDALLNRLSLAGDGIKRHESDLAGQLQAALTHLGSISEKLESNRVLTAEVSDEAVNRLNDVARAVEKQMNGLKEGSETVKNIVSGVGKMYTEQTQGMNRSVMDAQGQVLVMSKSIEEMQQRTDRMRVALKLQGEDLLNTLEQIHGQLSGIDDDMGGVASDIAKKQSEGRA